MRNIHTSPSTRCKASAKAVKQSWLTVLAGAHARAQPTHSRKTSIPVFLCPAAWSQRARSKAITMRLPNWTTSGHQRDGAPELPAHCLRRCVPRATNAPYGTDTAAERCLSSVGRSNPRSRCCYAHARAPERPIWNSGCTERCLTHTNKRDEQSPHASASSEDQFRRP
jgi:hypothetical protein